MDNLITYSITYIFAGHLRHVLGLYSNYALCSSHCQPSLACLFQKWNCRRVPLARSLRRRSYSEDLRPPGFSSVGVEGRVPDDPPPRKVCVELSFIESGAWAQHAGVFVNGVRSVAAGSQTCCAASHLSDSGLSLESPCRWASAI